MQDGLPDEVVLDQLEDVGHPLLIHAGEGFSPTDATETLLDRSFPVILSHFGGYPLNWDLMDDAIDLLDSPDDCYLDTSFVRYRDQLERAVMEHPDRVCCSAAVPRTPTRTSP